MQHFLALLKPIDWFVIAIIDVAVFWMGFIAGEDSVAAEKKTEPAK